MFGRETILNKIPAGGCIDTVDLYNPFPDGGGLALYQLNGDATDESGTYNGTATAVTYGAGEFGQAGVFNGSSSYVENSNIPNEICKGYYTVNVWAYIPSSQPYASVVHFQDDNNGHFPMLNIAVNNSNWNLNIRSNSSGIVNSTNIPITFNSWNMITGVLHSGGAKFYINGSEVASASFTPVFTTNTSCKFSLGRTNQAWISSVSAYLNGSIDQVRIFNRALRPYEVEALYTEEYCTPTIVPSEHFNTVTWTADGTSGDIDINGVGFQPDFVWAKARTQPYSHVLFDSVRGVGSSRMLFSDSANSESTNTANSIGNGFVSSFNADGFTGATGTSANSYFNLTGNNYVAWNFKAGGAAVTNTDGTITSQVSANTEAGFSVVTTTTNASGYLDFGHGLGVEPNVVIFKDRENLDAWYVYHSANTANPRDVSLILNTTAANYTLGGANKFIPSATVFHSGNAGWSYAANHNFIAYCFAEVEGFSSFGSYVGTGANTNAIVTGFEPAFLLVKQTNTARNWYVMDNKRNPENPKSKLLFPNDAGAEFTGSGDTFVDFLENGFEITPLAGDAINQSGGKYIYMAFAADPTTVEPSLEDSFNTVLYTGDGGSNRQVTGVGFQPDLVWIKSRNKTWWNHISDSIRGNNNTLFSNSNVAENLNVYIPSVSDPDGFTVSRTGGEGTNNSGDTYVAWNWKGAEIPAINSNGSIKSVVSANPAAGFSIVSYTGNSTNGATVGHGLTDVPKIIIYKRRDSVNSWVVKSSILGVNNYLVLNSTDASASDSGAFWNSALPTSSVFTLGSNPSVNVGTYIAYCFAEVAGFSKFGSYTGTGVAGNKQTTGFEPAFIMLKHTAKPFDWYILDNKRNPTNPVKAILFPNLSSTEANAGSGINFESDGFSFAGTDFNNGDGENLIYMAFANQF